MTSSSAPSTSKDDEGRLKRLVQFLLGEKGREPTTTVSHRRRSRPGGVGGFAPHAGKDPALPGLAGKTASDASSRRGGGARGGGASPRPFVHPRILDRRIEVIREGGRRRLRRLVAAASVVAAIGLAAAVAYSPVLGVRHVRIAGAQRTTEAEVRSVVHLGADRPMVEVDAQALAGRLRALPWVATARVTREWPSTVRISLTERAAVATLTTTAPCGAPDCVAVVDASGRVLALAPGAEARAAGLVAVTTGAPAGTAGSSLDASAGGALAVAAALPVSLHRRVTSIDAAPDGEVTLHLTPMAAQPAPTVLLGRPDRVADKLTAAATVLAAVKPDGIVTIDVRVPEAPALTRSGSNR